MASNENINVKVTIDTSQFDSSLDGMKKEMKELEKQLGSSILSEADKQAVLIRMGDLRHSIDDMNNEIKNIDAGNVFGDITTLATPLIGAFTAAGSAAQLLGIENEKVNEIIQKTTSLTIGLASLQQVADATKLKSLLKFRTEQVKSFIQEKLTFNLTKQQTAATIADSVAKGKGTIATQAITKAQLLWNAAMNSNPILIIISAIAALAAGVYLLSKALGDDTEELENNSVAMDGTRFASDELRDSYNEHIKTLRDLDIEYQVLIGTMTETEAALKTIDNALSDNITKIQNEYLVALKNLGDEQTTFWNKTLFIIKSTFIGYQNAILDETEKFNVKYKKLNDKRNADIARETQITNAKRMNLIEKFNRDILKGELESQLQLFNLRKKGLDDQIKIFTETGQKITEIFTKSRDKVGSLEFELKLLGIDDDTDKEIAKILEEQRKFTKETQLTDKELKTKQDLNQEALENLKEQYELLKKSRNAIIGQINPYTEIISKTKEQHDLAGAQLDDINQSWDETVKRLEEYISVGRRAGITFSDEVSGTLDTSEKIIQAQNELYNSQLLTGDQMALISALYSQRLTLSQNEVDLKIKLQELTVLENGFIKEKSDLNKDFLDSEKEYNKALVENTKLQQTTTGDLNKQVELNDDIVKIIIERIKQERLYQQALYNTNNELEISKLISSNLQKENDLRNAYRKQDLDSVKETEKLKLDEQRLKLNEYYQLRVGAANAAGDISGADLLVEQWDTALSELDQIFINRWGDIAQSVKEQMIDMSSLVTDAVSQIFERDIVNRFENLNYRLQEEYTKNQQTLQNQKDADLISEEEYNTKMEKLAEEQTKKELDLKIRQAKAEKKLAMFQIVIDTAMGVAKSWGQGGGLLGLPLSALVAAQGAIQLGVAASAPLPEFEKGGFIPGQDHNNGGVNVNAEGGEFIVNKDVAQSPGMSSLLNEINNGGINGNFMEDLKQTILSITSIPVVNVETQSTKVQRKVNTIETRARF